MSMLLVIGCWLVNQKRIHGGQHRQGPRTGTSAPMHVYLYHINQHSIGSLVALGLDLGLELEKDGAKP